jgi:hypothetical protein
MELVVEIQERENGRKVAYLGNTYIQIDKDGYIGVGNIHMKGHIKRGQKLIIELTKLGFKEKSISQLEGEAHAILRQWKENTKDSDLIGGIV